MFLLNWYKELINIRLEAEAIRINHEREKVCENCEYLKLQLEKAQLLNKELIDKLTKQETVNVVQEKVPVDLKPRNIPWNVRRQILEADDRKAAGLRKQVTEQIKVNLNPQGVIKETEIAPTDDPDVIALEREMDIISKERENAS